MCESRHWFCFGFGWIFEGPDPPKVCWRLDGSSISAKVACSNFGGIGMPKGLQKSSTNRIFCDPEPAQKMIWFLNAFLMDWGSQMDLHICPYGVFVASIFCLGSHCGHRRVPSALWSSFFDDFHGFWTNLARIFGMCGDCFLTDWDAWGAGTWPSTHQFWLIKKRVSVCSPCCF